ncbi:hypothetical protein [Listeria seeligeri]|uniref:hypothetical protein n=1 Tax=Listeria seeligeri TaxID=1640 RepID=UPI00162665F9|nr:hypothetical protein [Listeria seeligeri]EFS0529373.1 hypothetical protein [Listeria monocytogenes]EFU8668354.1 hypothetical protein [Listeria monocytogenes]MBC1744570.1 hypothetical protein [Listeria seeligeri]MBC1815616.1 hypothetical protein [Listeria seeligeri]MBC1832315.1 hypothetical protein [Listeria seeligeri]
MTDYYKITVELLHKDGENVYIANVSDFSIVPDSFDYKLLRQDVLELLGNRLQTGLYYTRQQHAEIDAVIAKLKDVLSKYETHIYAEWAFEY